MLDESKGFEKKFCPFLSSVHAKPVIRRNGIVPASGGQIEMVSELVKVECLPDECRFGVVCGLVQKILIEKAS